MSSPELIKRMQAAFPSTAQRCRALEQLLSNLNDEAVEIAANEEDFDTFSKAICDAEVKP